MSEEMKVDEQQIPEEALMCVELSEEAGYTLAEADGERQTRPFSMVVNSGEPILDHWYWGTFLFDLKGMKVRKRSIPVLHNHDPEQIVGYTEKTSVTDKGFVAEGQIILSDDLGAKVSNLSDAKFPWQASFYFVPMKTELVEEGASAKVNGKDIEGPARIIRECVVREVSFCALGADEMTEARAMAMGRTGGDKPDAGQSEEGQQMTDTQKNQNVVEGEGRLKLSAETLRNTHPEVASQLLSEGREQGHAEGVKEGAIAERARCSAIVEEAMTLSAEFPNGTAKLKELCLSLIDDGVEGVSAEKGKPSMASRELKLAAREAAAEASQKTPGANEDGEEQGRAMAEEGKKSQEKNPWENLELSHRDRASALRLANPGMSVVESLKKTKESALAA